MTLLRMTLLITLTTAPAASGGVQVLVSDATGKPIASATVWVITDYPRFPICDPDHPSESTTLTTDAAGRVDQSIFPTKPVNIMVTAPNYAPFFVRGITLDPTQPYRITLDAGQTITGTVTDTDGKPVAHARVTAEREEFIFNVLREFTLTGETDAQGRFTLSHAAEGPYTAQVQFPPGQENLFVDPATFTVHSEAPKPVNFAAGVGITLKGKFVGPEGFKLGGHRIDVQTRGAVGAAIGFDSPLSSRAPPSASGDAAAIRFPL